MIALTLGGIGLFLLGLVLLTDGLKATAGDALRRVIARFTGGALTAALSGAGLTVVAQSSSATILATIGFVSAGLLAFPQAMGVIFGAAVGTTSTGWIVSLLGLKLDLVAVALPLVAVGALMRLLGRGRIAGAGSAIAGFGLIFVGIDTLQAGMESLADRIDPEMLPGRTLPGRALLVLVGLAMTVVMQSSSAAVATTLTALYAGTVDLQAAALLVIGQNTGAAVPAAMASIGASVAVRRTAFAHITFNAFAGALALLLVPLFLWLAGVYVVAGGGVDATVAIAMFHTGFNVLAAALALPAAPRFAQFIARLVPERGLGLTRHLDVSVANVPPVAVEAARRTAKAVAGVIVESVRRLLAERTASADVRSRLAEADEALREARRFLSAVRTSPDVPPEYRRHVHVLHAMDHLDRMAAALRDRGAARNLVRDTELRAFAAEQLDRLGPFAALLESGDDDAARTLAASAAAVSRSVAQSRKSRRETVLRRTAAGEIEPDEALRRLEAFRWIDALLYHLWRAVHHLSYADGAPRRRGRQPDDADPSRINKR